MTLYRMKIMQVSCYNAGAKFSIEDLSMVFQIPAILDSVFPTYSLMQGMTGNRWPDRSLCSV
jgi:hypothetical protein